MEKPIPQCGTRMDNIVDLCSEIMKCKFEWGSRLKLLNSFGSSLPPSFSNVEDVTKLVLLLTFYFLL